MNTESIINKVKEIAADVSITSAIKAKYLANDILGKGKIKVVTKNGKVKLTGTLLSEEAMTSAVRIAKKIDGVIEVISNLKIDDKLRAKKKPQ